jgi:hypothetical protein
MYSGEKLGLPSEDRQLSPFTGWARAHWERVADVLLEGLLRHTSRAHAFVFVPDGQRHRRKPDDGLQGYARTFLLAALRIAGSEGAVSEDLAERYSTGLISGTDPTSQEAWPRIDHRSQSIVEAAFVAHALYESRVWIWDRLSRAEQERVISWLAAIRGKRVWFNNWLLFPVIVHAFLKSVGGPHSQQEMERGLDIIDTFYRSDGWYTDGAGANYDYYVGWGIHFYTLLWCRIDGDRNDPARAAVYRDRARRFLDHLRLFFAANGAPVYQGRSLTYRLATIAPFWAGALLGCTPLSPGETRRIASGVLRHFVEHGAICDTYLTRGWYRGFPPMIQSYSGAGSQYWASQGFLGLRLPATHPVWASREAPMPIDCDDFCVAFPEPGFLLHGSAADGILRLSNHGSDHYPLPLPPRAYLHRAAVRLHRELGAGHHLPAIANDDPHYCKLAYSSHAAPDVDDREDADLDSQLVLVRPGSGRSRRVRIYPLTATDRFAASVSYPGEPDWMERIETVAIVRGAAEIRVHHVTTVNCEGVRHGGWAVASADRPKFVTGDVWALAQVESGLTSFICALYGFEGAAVRTLRDANPIDVHSATPYLTARATTRPETVYVSMAVLSGVPLDPAETLAQFQSVEVRGRQVVIECAGGEWFFIQLVAVEPVDLRVGQAHLQGRIRLARVAPDGTLVTVRAPGI